jgi:hypothetical protein
MIRLEPPVTNPPILPPAAESLHNPLQHLQLQLLLGRASGEARQPVGGCPKVSTILSQVAARVAQLWCTPGALLCELLPPGSLLTHC